MFQIGDVVELEIEKMVYEGCGLSHKDGLVFFTDNVCDGDIVSAKIIKIKKNYINTKLVEIKRSSKYRIEPFCPLHNACGGCQWQFIDYEHQLEIKNNIVKEILSKALKRDVQVEETIASPDIKEFRHKIQMPVSQTKNSKRFLTGYYKKQSHELINIKYCPIQPKIVDDILSKFREIAQNYKVTAYNEKTHKGDIRHIIIRVSQSNGDILLCFVINNDKISDGIKELSVFLFNEYEQIKGVSVNFNQNKNNVILGQTTKNIIGKETYIETINDINYIISPESFFQINPKSFENILNKIKKFIMQNTNSPTILDAYSGVGSFGLYLSKIAKNVVCIEEVKQACKNAKNACELNKIKNVIVLDGDAQEIFEQLSQDNQKFDVVILDPPRKGCTKEALEYCAKLSKKFIVYVSCNPNSLARDLVILQDYGYELKSAQTVDMFCHTYHVETIAFIEKKQDLR